MYRPSPWFEAFLMGVVSFITSFIVWGMMLYFLSPWFWPSLRDSLSPLLVAAPPLAVAIGCMVSTYRHSGRTA